jgi:hypothetical protein
VELCQKRGVDVATAYKAMNINKGTISVWKKCATVGEPVIPSTKIAKKLAAYFEMPVEYFLYSDYQPDLGQEKKPTPDEGGERNYGDSVLMDAFKQADESTREAILLLLKLK